jgi:hypothetical protein
MRSCLLSTCAVLLATTTFAQVPPPAGGPPLAWQQSMTIGGTVTRFTLTPRGDLDGLLPGNGTQVHLPPHLSAELAAAVKTGDAVTVSGVRSPTGALFIASSVTDSASNQTVVDRGPPGPGLSPPPPPPGVPSPGAQSATVQGRLQRLLRGPAGDVDGALLDDGTILRMPPHIAYQYATLLVPGQNVAAQGWGLNTAYGRVIDVQVVGPPTAQLNQSSPQPGAFAAPGPVPPPPGSPLPPRR